MTDYSPEQRAQFTLELKKWLAFLYEDVGTETGYNLWLKTRERWWGICNYQRQLTTDHGLLRYRGNVYYDIVTLKNIETVRPPTIANILLEKVSNAFEEMYFAPGGPGYNEAATDFHSRVL